MLGIWVFFNLGLLFSSILAVIKAIGRVCPKSFGHPGNSNKNIIGRMGCLHEARKFRRTTKNFVPDDIN
jgi:hypothetical protein